MSVLNLLYRSGTPGKNAQGHRMKKRWSQDSSSGQRGERYDSQMYSVILEWTLGCREDRFIPVFIACYSDIEYGIQIGISCSINVKFFDFVNYTMEM